MTALLEIAVFHFESALIAQSGGADRIELCSNAREGGVSPDDELLKAVVAAVHIPLQIMVRPRGGNFSYTNHEFLQMCSEIEKRKHSGISGFVFGILTEDGTIDVERNAELVKKAYPLPCTFHRAFDECVNISEALEQVIKCGFTKVLTSGTASTAMEGANVLQYLVTRAGNRISIMPGGSVRSGNIRELQSITGASEFHSSAIVQGEIASEAEVWALKKALRV